MNLPVMFHSVEGPPEERTLFLGDLSVYCTEEEIFSFFSQFGSIEKVRLKHATNNKNLSYGFVTYTNRDVAARVLQTMNGKLFLGRALRLGWAAHKSQLSPTQQARLDNSTPSAQIHVSFLSKQTDILITETTLRSLFERFGEVSDVAIKKIQFNPKMKIQNGYGFIHFPLTKEGITAAITATNTVRQYTIDRVTYDSCLTRSLEIVIESPLYRGQLPQVIPYPEHANVVNKDYNNLQTYGNTSSYSSVPSNNGSYPNYSNQGYSRPHGKNSGYHRTSPPNVFPVVNGNNQHEGNHWMRRPQPEYPNYPADFANNTVFTNVASSVSATAAAPQSLVISSSDSNGSSPRLSYETKEESFSGYGIADFAHRGTAPQFESGYSLFRSNEDPLNLGAPIAAKFASAPYGEDPSLRLQSTYASYGYGLSNNSTSYFRD